MKKIVTVIGARPQFIKCAPVSRKIRQCFNEVIIHTGQHYDKNMSDIFFDELVISKPNYNLEVGSGMHGVQTAAMLSGIENILINEKPDAVIVYGDTNSTLAGTIAASKLHIPVFHIEAGLRSYNKSMPEEQNRIVTDVLSTILFCPTEASVYNLSKEGINKNVYNVGDVMYDSTIESLPIAEKKSNILQRMNVTNEEFIIATIHRAENTDNIERLISIIDALNEIDKRVIIPIHPRTRKIISNYNVTVADNINLIEPVGYFDMLVLQKNAKKIVTDSGGIQKEAFFLKTPCIVTRNETEWTELVDIGANILTGADRNKIINAIHYFEGIKDYSKYSLYGNGNSSSRICEYILKFLDNIS